MAPQRARRFSPSCSDVATGYGRARWDKKELGRMAAGKDEPAVHGGEIPGMR